MEGERNGPGCPESLVNMVSIPVVSEGILMVSGLIINEALTLAKAEMQTRRPNESINSLIDPKGRKQFSFLFIIGGFLELLSAKIRKTMIHTKRCVIYYFTPFHKMMTTY